MCMNQGSINSLLQCIVSLVNTTHSDKPGFFKEQAYPPWKSTDFFKMCPKSLFSYSRSEDDSSFSLSSPGELVCSTQLANL